MFRLQTPHRQLQKASINNISAESTRNSVAHLLPTLVPWAAWSLVSTPQLRLPSLHTAVVNLRLSCLF